VVGLAYDEEYGLPVVLLKAAGPVSRSVCASSSSVTGPRVVRDAGLLDQLYRLPLDAAIDPSLFQVVAVLLAHVLAINERMRDRGVEPEA
jgi:type III secretion system FlhB-like substrate exporter